MLNNVLSSSFIASLTSHPVRTRESKTGNTWLRFLLSVLIRSGIEQYLHKSSKQTCKAAHPQIGVKGLSLVTRKLGISYSMTAFSAVLAPGKSHIQFAITISVLLSSFSHLLVFSVCVSLSFGEQHLLPEHCFSQKRLRENISEVFT